MARETVDIEGLDEVIRALRALGDKTDVRAAEKILLKGAKTVANAAKSKAKGSIKAAIRAKNGKRNGKAMATAFAAVDRKKAPHAHLVEYGHLEVKGGSRRAGGRVVGQVPAHPFWRPALDTAVPFAQQQVESDLKNLLEEAWK